MKKRVRGGVVLARCAPGTGHRGCRDGRRRAERAQQAVLVIHTHRPGGAEVQLDLPACQRLTLAGRQRLEEAFEVWSVAAWVMPGAIATLHERGGRWTRVAPSVLDDLLVDIARLAFEATPVLTREGGSR